MPGCIVYCIYNFVSLVFEKFSDREMVNKIGRGGGRGGERGVGERGGGREEGGRVVE